MFSLRQASGSRSVVRPMCICSRGAAAFFLISLAWFLPSSRALAQTQRFENPPLIPTSLDPAGITVADWNGDGHLDIVYIERSPTPSLHLLLGNGKGGFAGTTPVSLPAGTCTIYVSSCRLTAGNFTGDGHLDLLTTWQSSGQQGFLVLPGNGDGTFGAPVVSSFPLGVTGSTIAVYGSIADYDGNGTLDLAVPDYANSTIDLYSGDGKGHFNASGSLREPAANLFASDVNHDGAIDLIAVDAFNGRVAVWWGNGKGAFTLGPSFYPVSNCGVNTVADMNGDGNIDLVCGDGQGNVGVQAGKIDGTFGSVQIIASGLDAGDRVLVATDLNGDGVPDLITTSSVGFGTILSEGPLSYGAVQRRTSGGVESAMLVAIADINEDGIPDVVAGVSGGIQVFPGNAQGNYPDPTIIPVTTPVTFVYSGDFNGDGFADVVAMNTGGTVATWFGSKDGISSARATSPLPANSSSMGDLVGDFDGDGKKDIVFQLLNTPNATNVLYGNGDGTFTAVAAPGGQLSNALVADVNGDGKSDLVGISSYGGAGNTGSEYGLITLLGQGNRSFVQVVTGFPPYPPTSGITTPALLGLGDLNGDGFADAVVYDENVGLLETWLGNGDGSFVAGSNLDLAAQQITAADVGGQDADILKGTMADLDGDGFPDAAFLATVTAEGYQQEDVLMIAYGDGKGGFSSTQLIPLTHHYTVFMIGKIDDAGLPGLILGSGVLGAAIHNLGGRHYGPEVFFTAGYFSGLALADFDGDGYDDILVGRSSANVSPHPNTSALTVLMNQPTVTGPGMEQASGTLSASATPVSYDQAFVLTAGLQSPDGTVPVPTGTVQFLVGGLTVGTVTLLNGSASLQVPATITATLPIGIALLEAQYSGDSNYLASELTGSLTVLPPSYPTQISLALTAAGSGITSIQADSFVTMSAMVTAGSGVIVPRGYVAFYDGGTLLGQAESSSGTASYSTNLLGIGAHSLTAQYLGYSPSNAAKYLASTSAAVPLTVTAVTTTISVTGKQSVVSGSVLTLTAAAGSATGPPVGGVTFLDGTTVLGTRTLDGSGTASFSTVSLAAGQHAMTAQYTANNIFAGSQSPPLSIIVTPASSTLQPVSTFIAGVTPSASSGTTLLEVHVNDPSGHVPDGIVTLLVDGQLAGSATLPASGIAFLPVSLAAGVHSFYASFGGNGVDAPAASPVFATTAYGAAADFTIAAGRLTEGTILKVGTLNAWAGTVTFACSSGVPAGYACNFTPAAVTGTGTTRLTLERTFSFSRVALVLPLTLLLCGWRRRAGRALAVLLLAGVFAGVTSCADPTSAVKESVITVQATAGDILHSVQILMAGRSQN